MKRHHNKRCMSAWTPVGVTAIEDLVGWLYDWCRFHDSDGRYYRKRSGASLNVNGRFTTYRYTYYFEKQEDALLFVIKKSHAKESRKLV